MGGLGKGGVCQNITCAERRKNKYSRLHGWGEGIDKEVEKNQKTEGAGKGRKGESRKTLVEKMYAKKVWEIRAT